MLLNSKAAYSIIDGGDVGLAYIKLFKCLAIVVSYSVCLGNFPYSEIKKGAIEPLTMVPEL